MCVDLTDLDLPSALHTLINVIKVFVFLIWTLFYFFQFILIEGLLLRQVKTTVTDSSKTPEPRQRNTIHVYFCAIFNVLLPFMYGAAVVQLVTDIAKYSVGRLRPHFLNVCKPDYTKFNCTDGYILADVCTGDTDLIKRARYEYYKIVWRICIYKSVV